MTDAPDSAFGQGRTVLVLDDEDSLRSVMRRILEKHGFEVVEAGTAPEAFDLMDRSGEVALIICDLILPGLGGREAGNIFQARAPEVPILFTSGYSSFSSGRREVQASGHPFLSKPFDIDEFTEAVQEALGEA